MRWLRAGNLNRLCNFACFPIACVSTAALSVTGGTHAAVPPAPELVSVKKIWDEGAHNAFTDLIRFRDEWLCTFREAAGHVKGDGKIRVIRSKDGKTWSSAALLAEEGVDLRDPKISIMPDGRLMIVAGGSIYRDGEFITRQPRVAFSSDGNRWTETTRILSDGQWLWRVTWHEGKGYGVSYNATAYKSGRRQWSQQLFVTTDGIDYEKITDLEVTGYAGETTLRFLPNDTMIAMVRRESENKRGWIGRSRPPYRRWKWHEANKRFGGPDFIILDDGSMWAGSRLYSREGARTVLARFGPATYDVALVLPSGGDTSYPGLVHHDGLLWMSYYSSHEGKTSIYLARIKLPD